MNLNEDLYDDYDDEVTLNLVGVVYKEDVVNFGLNYGYDGEITMDKEHNQRQYLNGRVYDIWQDHDNNLRTKFGLADDDPPKTWKEMVERLATKQYKLPTKFLVDEAVDSYGDPCVRTPSLYRFADALRWRDPNKKEDYEGYKAAAEILKQDCTTLKDTITVMSPEKGLEALREFEAKTYN